MDLDAMLRELVRDWKRINRAITRLEAQQAKMESRASPRRGRKGMGAEERLEVSRRMTEYWRARRARAKEAGTDKPPT